MACGGRRMSDEKKPETEVATARMQRAAAMLSCCPGETETETGQISVIRWPNTEPPSESESETATATETIAETEAENRGRWSLGKLAGNEPVGSGGNSKPKVKWNTAI